MSLKVVDKTWEILFHDSIETLRLSIGPGVVQCREADLTVKLLAKGFSKCHYELGS